MMETLVGIAATIFLALLGWMIKGLLTWGRTIGQVTSELSELSKKTQATANDISEIRSRMLSQADLENAVLKLKLEVLRGALGTGTRMNDPERPC
jgi:hypothetical protein